MTNEQIAAMAAWTLEDFQNDPLGAMAQIRELAASHLSLQRERDAAVKDIEDHPNCEVCINYSGDSDVTGLPLCEDYLEHRDLRDCFEWRGPQPEQVLAPADQSAGEYADNPVLAQA